MEYDNGAVDGARITSNRMLHDMEAEYVVKNISKENCLLYTSDAADDC